MLALMWRIKESTEVALAVAQSLEPAHTPPQDADANYLRQCLQCGQVSYLRQGVCLSPSCQESYLSLPAEEVGRRLQSWGKPDSNTKATDQQMEKSRQKRLAQSDWSGASKRSKGRRHREWTESFRQGVHPRTGKEGMDKPVWWKDGWWVFQQSLGWARCSHEHAIGGGVAPVPDATAPDATAPADATGPVPKAIGDSAGPKASYGPKPPVPTPEAEERLRRAQQMKDERLQEQRRHAAEANYGYATSARPSPIGPPAAKKSPGVPTPKEHLVNLYNAVSEESKALAYDAMAKALSSPPVVKEPALPVKAMPPLPPWRQELFMHQMASQLSSMLMESLGMPVPPPPKPATLVIYGNPGPKMLPAAVEVHEAKAPEPKASLPACAVNEIAGDTTEEEEGEEPTRDD